MAAPMRVISVNVNGLRSALRKGFWEWMGRSGADVVCLQEVRAHPEQLPAKVVRPRTWHAFYQPAERRGYSGVAVFSRRAPDRVQTELDDATWDHEGRFLRADFGALSIVSIYVPSGSSSETRQAEKMRALGVLDERLDRMRKERRSWILCGDWNIAHRAIDLKNWRSNQKNSGFLPEERAWMDRLFAPKRFVDAFRTVNPDAEQYTWWSNRGQAWAKNVGWRIDYHVVSPDLADKVERADIYKRKRFSDHAPLTIDYVLS